MWHYNSKGNQVGPISQEEMMNLVKTRVLSPYDMVWKEGMATWGRVADTELGVLVPPPDQRIPPPFSPQGALTLSSGSAADKIKKLNTYFMVFWICMAAGLPLCVLIVGIFGVIAGAVFMYMLIYELWKLVPTDIARTTPGKAVGFCFIPFFNFYWIFVAFRGLGEDLNKTFSQRGIQYQVNEGLGLAYCVLVCACIIPYVGFLAVIAALIVVIFFLKSAKDGAVLMLQQQGN